MNSDRTIRRALISVYDKNLILDIANELVSLDVEILSTGGTQHYLTSHNIPVTAVEDVTGYPSIFGGRVKTLHPKVMGGILYRREEAGDLEEREKYEIPGIDLVIVDLYPFEEYVAKGASEEEIIEKIDIGGITLIRAAAKNFRDVIIVPGKDSYADLLELLRTKKGVSSIEDRRRFAARAFLKSSGYDTHIFQYFNRREEIPAFTASETRPTHLRYGENPHQKAMFYGSEDALPEQLHGKEISYNNMLDIEAALELISDFDRTAVAVIKHNNACGCAEGDTVLDAWNAALAADPVSAFGGIIVSNRPIDKATAEEMHKIFFEVIIAPDYSPEALDILEGKKNRIILRSASARPSAVKFRSMLGGVLVQDRDTFRESPADLRTVTKVEPTREQIDDMLFANIIVKHSKSNAIVLAKNHRLIASGIGQTSRVDALKQAIEKARSFGFSLEGAVMASDAFFPFADCVEIADKAGIKAVIHPGGSIRDNESVEYCDAHGLAMVMTGHRHFKH